MYIITFLRTNPFYKIQLISAKKKYFKQPQGTSPKCQAYLISNGNSDLGILQLSSQSFASTIKPNALEPLLLWKKAISLEGESKSGTEKGQN